MVEHPVFHFRNGPILRGINILNLHFGQDQGQQPQKPQGENRRHDRQQRKDRNRRLKPGDKPDNTAPGEGRNARQDVAPAMSPSKRMLNQNGDNGN